MSHTANRAQCATTEPQRARAHQPRPRTTTPSVLSPHNESILNQIRQATDKTWCVSGPEWDREVHVCVIAKEITSRSNTEALGLQMDSAGHTGQIVMSDRGQRHAKVVA